jgi:polyferredoxin
MVLVLVFAVYTVRSWCMYLCPLGALMAIFNRFSFLGLKRDPLRCNRIGCRTCVEVCPTRVKILDRPWEKFSDPECILCLKCVSACKDKAISLKFP